MRHKILRWIYYFEIFMISFIATLSILPTKIFKLKNYNRTVVFIFNILNYWIKIMIIIAVIIIIIKLINIIYFKIMSQSFRYRKDYILLIIMTIFCISTIVLSQKPYKKETIHIQADTVYILKNNTLTTKKLYLKNVYQLFIKPCNKGYCNTFTNVNIWADYAIRPYRFQDWYYPERLDNAYISIEPYETIYIYMPIRASIVTDNFDLVLSGNIDVDVVSDDDFYFYFPIIP